MLVNISIDDDRPLTREDFITLVKARDGYVCRDCFKRDDELETIKYRRYEKLLERSSLQAHHLDNDPDNNILSNGICLCVSCHNKRHEDKKNDGLRQRNLNGQASRAGLKGWEKINSMSEEKRKIWLSNRANKIWESRRAKENGRDQL